MSLELDEETLETLGLSRNEESTAEILYASHLKDLARLLEWRAEHPELVAKQNQKYRSSDSNRAAQRRYYDSEKGKATAARKALRRKAKRLAARLQNAAQSTERHLPATNDAQTDMGAT